MTALLLLMVHTVANALLRYLAGSPITGTNEYVGYWYLPIVAFLGFYFAQRSGSHIEARLVFDRLPRTNQLELQLAGQVLLIALCVGFAYHGLLEAIEAVQLGLTAGVANIVIWPVLFVVPLGFTLFAARLVIDAIATFRTRDPDAAHTEQAGEGVLN
ncbi:TRAP transporter small permease [Haloechinothrix sp. LS1_15]|uniref:TRAP transporter small permease n=1 Tax=Haloechinothrix sp. LS1_15 TaxID=2652248 RepID=UPI00294AD0A0|nr:TRAP transporter small permease [Haloechinothrix sp. LS1_15]